MNPTRTVCEALLEFQNILSRRHLFGALITSSADIQYLLRLDRPVTDAWLWVGQRRCYYLTDGRYTAQWCPLMTQRGIGLLDEGPLKALRRLLRRSGRIGFEPDDITHRQYLEIKKILPHRSRLVSLNGWVKKRRMIKSPDELEATRTALGKHEALLRHLQRWLRPGLSEIRVAWEIERFIRLNGAQLAFDPIAASGPNSAYPHAYPTERTIQKNDVLLVDCGVRVKGYCSDLTRHFVFGKINHSFMSIYEKVKEAQQKAISVMKSGVKTSIVDRTARTVLRKWGLDGYFRHSLGHGVGLEIHEPPRLSSHDNTVLKADMLVTVEPGVYLENKFGIRVEDMIIIGDQGSTLLSQPENRPYHIIRC